MGLRPDSKRTWEFRLFSQKKHNPTMLDKGGVAVYSTSSACSDNNSHGTDSKFHTIFPQSTPFHPRERLPLSFESYIVGGFLGSKSQGRSGNTCQSIWDKLILPNSMSNFLDAASKCFANHHDLHSVPSPPKKKFAKEESLANPTIVDLIEFPSVIKKLPSQENTAEGPKQSYAEVAKATSSKLVKPSRSRDLNDHSGNQDSCNHRRTKCGDHRRGRKKSNRRNRKGSVLPHSTDPSTQSSTSSEPQFENWKDLRLNQQEKHFSHLKLTNNRNPKRFERSSNSSSCPSRRDHFKEHKMEGGVHSKRRSNYRDNKRGSRTQIIDCDIDKINWRTGEPIGYKMDSHDVSGDNVHLDDSSPGSFSKDQGSAENTEVQRQQDFSPSDSCSWTDIQVASPLFRRRSLSSECSVDSEDSFVIFQSGAPSDSLSDLASDWSECDSDDSFDSESDVSEEDDSCDGLSPSSLRLKEVNELWQKEYVDSTSHDAELYTGNKEREKKVHFSSSHPRIHRMLTWDFAYRSSRLGPWEEMARDRERFRTRIRQFECIISPVLAPDHRNKIWNQLNHQQNS